METLNQYLPKLNVTHESSQKKVVFLDLHVSLENDCVTTYLYTKNTDYHQYLHRSPKTLRSPKKFCSQALSLSNICTYEKDFQRHALDMK